MSMQFDMQGAEMEIDIFEICEPNSRIDQFCVIEINLKISNVRWNWLRHEIAYLAFDLALEYDFQEVAVS